jgi:glucokinase
VNVLAGDVGGTNTRLALFEGRGEKLLVRKDYPSREHGALEEVLARFREDLTAAAGAGSGPAFAFTAACFGVAGPVVEGVCRTTNLPWVVDTAALRAALACPRVRVVNDFYAAALGVTRLDAGAFEQVGGAQRPTAGAPIAVLGAGTGLGEAFLAWVEDAGDSYGGGRWTVIPSEGGHADFAPRDEEEIALLRFLLRRHDHVSYERVLSGAGLVTLYEFYRDEVGVPESPATRAALAAGEDPARVVSRLGLAGTDPVCVRALARFCSVYGAEAGNVALKALAKGGVYLAGGIAARNLEALRGGAFRAAFEDKGRYRALLESIPTRVVTADNLGLRGAAAEAARLAAAAA